MYHAAAPLRGRRSARRGPSGGDRPRARRPRAVPFTRRAAHAPLPRPFRI